MHPIPSYFPPHQSHQSIKQIQYPSNLNNHDDDALPTPTASIHQLSEGKKEADKIMGKLKLPISNSLNET